MLYGVFLVGVPNYDMMGDRFLLKNINCYPSFEINNPEKPKM
tara:strand:- start:1366 stop:1491 length:126 start_codon:yes stop_codon:yes gene_type:complete